MNSELLDIIYETDERQDWEEYQLEEYWSE